MSATACNGSTSAWYAGGNASRQVAEGVDAGFLATGGDERVAQLVGPRARDRRELRFELGFVDRRRVGAGRLHHDVESGEHCVAHEHGEIDFASPERASQRVEDRDADLGRIAVAREVHEA